MPHTDIQAKRKTALAYYYRKAADPAWRAETARRVRDARRNMPPDKKAVYLAKKAAKQREKMRSNPEYRAAQLRVVRESYRRRKIVDPGFQAAQARRGYVKNVAWRLVNCAKLRSAKKGIAFDLTKEWAEKRWTGRCELTGIQFVMAAKTMSPYSPSLDRIYPKLGYTQGNCRFILMGVNSLKNAGTDEDVMRIAEAIVGTRCA